MRNRSKLPYRLALGVSFALCLLSGFNVAAFGQVVIAPPPTVGSSNPVSPEPTVPRPATTPCKVTLLTNQAFADFNNVSFNYAPPSACPGPWAKVVFSADFTVSAGRQFDRSSAFYLGNATLFRGTTAEPRAALSPSWHVESDVTDLSALMNTNQAGVAAIGNLVNSTYTGIIYANAELDFYPTSDFALAAVVPNAVIPIVNDPTNPAQSLSSTTPLTMSVTLPKNVTQLYMNVISQFNGADEFFYLSTPNAQAAPYIQGMNTSAFREIDIAIDGKPAGIAPNHPYVFTGGIDPYLWEPITGAQTLNLRPYRVNLTPFAGLLSDGNPHTITLTEVNAQSNYLPNADLLVYTDPTAATTTGSVTTNTLTANPATNVTSSVNLDTNGNGTAEINESLARTFTITGSTTGSAGKVTTTVAETVSFSNAQQLTNSATQNVVVENLTSTVDSTETTSSPTGSTTYISHTENPLQAFLNFVTNTDGSFSQFSTVELRDVNNISGPGSFTSRDSEDVMSTDQLNLDGSFNVTSHTGQSSTGTYSASDSLGNSYSSTLNAANNVLTGATINDTSTGSTLFVTATPTTLPQGATVTLTATVMPTNSALVPRGRITFYSNGSALSILNLAANGQVSVGINFLRPGANVITATYDGDANFIPQSSMNPLTVTVTAVAGSFTVGPVSPATTSVSAGGSAIVSVPVTSGSSFTGVVALSCTGAPSRATCVVNPGSVSLVPSTGGTVSSQTVSVVVTTMQATAQNVVPSIGNHLALPLGGVTFAGILMLMLPKRRRKAWSSYNWKSKTLTVLMFCGIGLCSIGALSGCGSGAKNTGSTGTPPGTYTITVTGTSGSVTQSATFALTVN